MKKTILTTMLLLGTSLFSMEHKHIEKNHQNHQINSNKNIPQDAKCQVCGMFVVKYENWIASIKVENETFYFDGVKDMLKFYFEPTKYSKIDDLKDASIFVTEYYTLEKIDAKNAFFVLGSNVMGPMGAEFIPFKDENSAKEFKKEHFGTKILKFDEIKTSDIPAKHH